MDGTLANEAVILIRLCISNIIMLCFINKLKIIATMTHIVLSPFGQRQTRLLVQFFQQGSNFLLPHTLVV